MSYKNIIGGGQLRTDAANAWNRLQAAYKTRFGAYLSVVSALRTRAEQTRLYNGWIRRLAGFYLAARPGTSLHEKGLSVDVGSPANVAGSTQHSWLVANGPKFGFTWTGRNFSPRENWHFDYTGGGSAGTIPFSQTVANQQEFLNKTRGEKLVVDGRRGSKTKAAIKRYQKFLGVFRDGIWGDNTQAAHAKNVAAIAKAAARASTPAKSTTILRRGSKGAAVKKLQETLNAWFPAYSKLKIDSDYGPATEAVVIEMQERAELTVDGIAGDQVHGYLGI